MFSGHDRNVSGHDLKFTEHERKVSGHDQKDSGYRKDSGYKNITPDTIVHDTLPDPVSKISPPADQGRTGESRPCPLCLDWMVFL